MFVHPCSYPQVVRYGLSIYGGDLRLQLALASVLVMDRSHGAKALAVLAKCKTAIVAALRPLHVDGGWEKRLSSEPDEEEAATVEAMLDGMMDDDDGDGVRRRLRVDASKNWLAEWKGWWGDVWAAGSAWGMGQGVVAEKRALLEAWRLCQTAAGLNLDATGLDEGLGRTKRSVALRYGLLPEEDEAAEDNAIVESEELESTAVKQFRDNSRHSRDQREDATGRNGRADDRKECLENEAMVRGKDDVFHRNGAAQAGSGVGRGNGARGDCWSRAAQKAEDSLEVVGFPHVLPDGLLRWIKSHEAWRRWDAPEGLNTPEHGVTGGLGAIMLDKTRLAAEEEWATVSAVTMPTVFARENIKRLVALASQQQRVRILQALLRGEPAAWHAAERGWAAANIVAVFHQEALGPSDAEIERRRALVCEHPGCGVVGCGGDFEPFWLFPRDRWRTLPVRQFRKRREVVLPRPWWAMPRSIGEDSKTEPAGWKGERWIEECRARRRQAEAWQAIESDGSHPEYARTHAGLRGNTVFVRALHYLAHVCIPPVMTPETLEKSMRAAASGSGRAGGVVAVVVGRVGKDAWEKALRWARGGFAQRVLPQSEDMRASLRLRISTATERTEGGRLGGIEDGDGHEVGLQAEGRPAEVATGEEVDYERERLDRIVRNREALMRVGLGVPQDNATHASDVPEKESESVEGARVGGSEMQAGAEGVKEKEGDELRVEESVVSDMVLALPPPVW